MIDPRAPDYSSTPFSAKRTLRCASAWHRPTGERPATPVVSVVTPFFNTREVFRETAACVLGQTLQNFEWVIVNDCSTDERSLAVLAGLRGVDPRVRVLDLPRNVGLSGARNAGYAAARAGLVFQLDSDDLIEATTLEKCAWYLSTHPQHGMVKGYSVGFGAQEYLWTRGFHDGPEFLKENLVTATAMVRKSLWERVGGFDAGNRGGLEDWDFWLACAHAGHWGATIPEYMDWYRRRGTHGADWTNWEKRSDVLDGLRRKFPTLWSGAFPSPAKRWPVALEPVREELALLNPLARTGSPRVLMIVPWLTMGGADKFNLSLVEMLTGAGLGWEVTIVTTQRGDHSWSPEFAKFTHDILASHAFCEPADLPALLLHAIESRRPDVVLISNSEAGHMLLPFLRAHAHEGTAFVDYSHMEEEHWKSGGHPRAAAGMSEQFDMIACTSEHLRRWMMTRGADAARTRAVPINVDADRFAPNGALRSRTRAELGIGEATGVLLYAGRLCAQKQPDVFARTVRLLGERGVEFVALAAGEGPLRAATENALRVEISAGLVRFLGAKPADEMHAMMAASDIFFLPSEWEGIALVAYEAMASGLVFVGADVGGQSELVVPGTGVLLPRGSAESEAVAYADALELLLRDSDARSRIGRAARERIERHFRVEQMGAAMDALLRDACAIARAEPRPRLSHGLAREWAVRCVDALRMQELTEWLWSERQGTMSRGIDAGTISLHAPSGSGPRALEELVDLESSRAWRAVSKLKSNALYDAVARARWGASWRLVEAKESPEQRLARIKQSRAYRLIQAIKATGAYRTYAKGRSKSGKQ